jgi:hypothetical protein
MHVLVEQSLTIRSRKSKKDRQYYGQKKKDTTQKTKYQATRMLRKPGVNSQVTFL